MVGEMVGSGVVGGVDGASGVEVIGATTVGLVVWLVVGDADGGGVGADMVGSCAGEGVGSEVVGGIEDDVAGPDVVGDTGAGTVGSVAAGDADGEVVGFGARRRLRRSSRRRGSWIWVDGWAGWIRRCW